MHLSDLFNTSNVIAVDIETTYNVDPGLNDGLNPHRSRIAVVSYYRVTDLAQPLTVEDAKYQVILDQPGTPHVIKQLAIIWRDPTYTIVGTCLSFDFTHLYWHYPTLFPPQARKCKVVSVDVLVRTLLGDYRDERKDTGYTPKSEETKVNPANYYVCKSYSLQAIAQDLLGLWLDKAQQTSDWSKALTEEQATYVKYDVYAPLAIYQALWSLFAHDTDLPGNSPLVKALYDLRTYDQEGLCESVCHRYRTEECAWYVCYTLNCQVYHVDTDYYQHVRHAIDTAKAYWEEEYKRIEPELSPNQYVALGRKYNLESVNKDVYMAVVGNHADVRKDKTQPLSPQAQELLHKTVACGTLKTARTHADKLLGVMGGRNWTSWNSCSGTGRAVSSNKGLPFPNMQAIKARVTPLPRKDDEPDVNFNLRRIIKPTPGYSYFNLDLPTAHLRIAFALSCCRNGLTMLRDGVDLHSYTGVRVYNQQLKQDLTYDQFRSLIKQGDKVAKSYRGWAKNTIFAWLNGSGAQRIHRQIETNSLVAVDLDTIIALRQTINETFPEVPLWIKSVYNWLLAHGKLYDVGGRNVTYYSLLGCPHLNTLPSRFRPHLSFPGKYQHEWRKELQPQYTTIPAAIWANVEVALVKQLQWDVTQRYDYDEVRLAINHYDGMTFEIRHDLFEVIAPQLVDLLDDYLQECLPTCPSGIDDSYRAETLVSHQYWV